MASGTSTPIPYHLLMRLHQISQQLKKSNTSTIKRGSCCPHSYYPSIELFSSHVLWYLERGYACSKTVKYHSECFMEFFRICTLCGICLNSILSSVSIETVMSRILKHIPNANKLLQEDEVHARDSIAIPVISYVHLLIYDRLLDHPQFPKIVMNICRRSTAIFPSMMQLLRLHLLLALYRVGDKDNDIGGEYWDFLLPRFAKMIYLTVKYWNEDQCLYYQDYHFGLVIGWTMDGLWPAMDRSTAIEMFTDQLGRDLSSIDHVEQYEAAMFIQSAFFRRCAIKRFPLFSEKELISTRLSTNILLEFRNCKQLFVQKEKVEFECNDKLRRHAIKVQNMETLKCGFMECDKTQSDIEGHLKLCARCKMTYYCCRSCQKRAWPQHKLNCNILSHRYDL